MRGPFVAIKHTDFPNHFILRRLHSLTGVVPTGVFLISHLLTNSSVAWGNLDSRAGEYGHGGVATFQHEVKFIHSIPYLFIIEVFGLWLPIAFHSILGFYYALSGKSNIASYSYQDNWRYTLQRISGYLGILFIFYHIATLRWGWTFLIPGGAKWDHNFAASTLAQALQGGTDGITGAGLAISAFYFIGVSLLVFHFANGLWTAAITWGITVSVPAQKRWGIMCAGLGIALMAMAWASVIGYVRLDVSAARQTEQRMLDAHGETPKTPEKSVGTIDLAAPR